MTAAGFHTHQLVLDVASKNQNQNTVIYYLLKNKLSNNNNLIKIEEDST